MIVTIYLHKAFLLINITISLVAKSFYPDCGRSLTLNILLHLVVPNMRTSKTGSQRARSRNMSLIFKLIPQENDLSKYCFVPIPGEQVHPLYTIFLVPMYRLLVQMSVSSCDVNE